MSTKDQGRRTGLLLVALAGLACCSVSRLTGAELVCQTIYASIPGQSVIPSSALVQATDGNFYGTGLSASTGGYACVFRVTPAGVVSTVVVFRGGEDILGGLVAATNGSLYGTTASGGAYNYGTLFKFTPPFSFQTLHSFVGSDGAIPVYDLIQGSDGSLYGVTAGRNWTSTNAPTVFRATLAGAVTTLTNFSQAMPGVTVMPSDGLVQGPDGWLYGTADIAAYATRKIAALYKISTNGVFQTLAFFEGETVLPWGLIGIRPIGGLAAGTDGCLYGTTGANNPHYFSGNIGTVFRMTTNGELTTLVAFDGTNGSNPMSRMLLAKDGSLYGLTTRGGPSGRGTIFRVTTDGVLTTLADGLVAYGVNTGPPPLVQARDGNFYGAGLTGGSTGLVYRLVPPPTITAAAWSSGKVTLTWHSFTNGAYRIAYKSAPNASSWITQASTINATGTSTSASDFPGIVPQRIYQVVLLP